MGQIPSFSPCGTMFTLILNYRRRGLMRCVGLKARGSSRVDAVDFRSTRSSSTHMPELGVKWNNRDRPSRSYNGRDSSRPMDLTINQDRPMKIQLMDESTRLFTRTTWKHPDALSAIELMWLNRTISIKRRFISSVDRDPTVDRMVTPNSFIN